ncbi:MAG: PIN domain-containing protein [Planctomycetes bacterium]|nr:PIN domain-containing protein [Planctomycetota bacterium]
MQGQDRVFLDANVLLSAAWRAGARLAALWEVPGAALVTSTYALEEARRNLEALRPAAVARLERLCQQLEVVEEADVGLAMGTELAEKDLPILAAALGTRCTHLLTGDHQHFGRFFGRRIRGLLVLTPSRFLEGREPADHCE